MTLGKIALHDIDVQKLCSIIDSCKGDVFLITAEGDRLNLKSKLCQVVGLTNLIQGGNIAEATLCCTNADDDSKLFRFALYGEEVK